MEQPWFADDGAGLTRFASLQGQFTRLQEIGPIYGYIANVVKSKIVVTKNNFESVKAYFADLEFKVTMGSHYLGGFIGEAEDLDTWINGKVTDWSDTVAELANAAIGYPQSAYSGLQHSLQQEWQFVQRVTKGVSDKFAKVEKEILETFLLALFADEFADNDPQIHLASLPVKKAGLALPNPVKSADQNYEASILLTSHATAALRGTIEFSLTDHASIVRNIKSELKFHNSMQHKKKLTSIVSRMPCDEHRMILRGKDTGQWLSVVPSMVNGTELVAQEFHDSLLL